VIAARDWTRRRGESVGRHSCAIWARQRTEGARSTPFKGAVKVDRHRR